MGAVSTLKVESTLKAELAANGYAVLPDLIEPGLMDRFAAEVRASLRRAEWDFEIDGKMMYGERIRRAFDLVGKSPALLEVLALPMIETVMRASLLDYCDHVLLSAATALEVSRQPGADTQPLHRDENSYCPSILPRVPGGPEYTLNIMVAGTDFTAENGATLIIPGSHLWPRERKPTPDDPVITLDMPRGGCGVWLGSIFHAAGVNRTAEPRLGIALSFNLGWLRTIENQFLLLDPPTVSALPASVQRLLGYDAHGVLGVHDWRSPMQSLLNA